MNALIRTAITLAAIAAAAQASAQVTFYENDGFGGRTFSTQSQVEDLYRFGKIEADPPVIPVFDFSQVP